jgi:4-hydroxybenzoyl-CoA reductase subunit beta
MHLDPFQLHQPTTVEEATEIAHRYAGDVDYLGGGTDLLPNYKMHLNLRHHVIALNGIPELHHHGMGRIGAMVALADLERDPEFGRAFPAVAEALAEVATPLVRASATIGGNLLVETRCFFFNQSYFWRQSLGFCLKADGDRCHVVPQKERCYATFSGDLAPSLEVLNASVEIAGPSGRREVLLTDLYDRSGDGILRHHLRPGELLVSIHLPPASQALPSTYLKLRVRPSFDFPELGIAAAGRFSGDRLDELLIAVGGLETYPRRFDELTRPMAGSALTDPRIEEISQAIQRAVRPVHNTFLAPDYRKKMTGVFVRRALERLRSVAIGGDPRVAA